MTSSSILNIKIAAFISISRKIINFKIVFKKAFIKI